MTTSIILVAIFSIEAIFIAIRKPYSLGFWQRPLFNKIITAIICLLFVGASITSVNSMINELIPLGILLLLMAVLTVNIIGAAQ